jgi:prevent-host-death family protein
MGSPNPDKTELTIEYSIESIQFLIFFQVEFYHFSALRNIIIDINCSTYYISCTSFRFIFQKEGTKMKQLITIREANQYLSRYIEAVQGGEEIIITRRGLPVARLTAVAESSKLNDRQKAARKRSLARMRKGYALGGKIPVREALHER